jgi:hypothetical protein
VSFAKTASLGKGKKQKLKKFSEKIFAACLTFETKPSSRFQSGEEAPFVSRRRSKL